jgi:hypothetical protein
MSMLQIAVIISKVMAGTTMAELQELDGSRRRW